MYENIVRHVMGAFFGLSFALTFWGGWWAKERGWWWIGIPLLLITDWIFLKVIKSLR